MACEQKMKKGSTRGCVYGVYFYGDGRFEGCRPCEQSLGSSAVHDRLLEVLKLEEGSEKQSEDGDSEAINKLQQWAGGQS